MKLSRHFVPVVATALLGLLLTAVSTWAARDEFEREVAMLFSTMQERVESAARLELVEHYEKLAGWRDALTIIPSHHESEIGVVFRSQLRGARQTGLRELGVFGNIPGAAGRARGRPGNLPPEYIFSPSPDPRMAGSLVIKDASLFLHAVSKLATDGSMALFVPGDAGVAATSGHIVVLPVLSTRAAPGRDRPAVDRWLIAGLDFKAILAGAHPGSVHNLFLCLRDPARDMELAKLNGIPEAGMTQVSRAVAFGGIPLELVVAMPANAILGDERDWTWIVLIATLAMTSLATFGVYVLLNRRMLLTQRASQLQRRVRDSQQRFRDIVESSRDWVWEMDANGVYTYSSPSSEWLFGYSPEKITGTTGEFLWLNPGSVQRRPGDANRVRVFRHRTGATITLESHSVEVRSPQGTVLGYRGFDRDISQRLQMEGELHALQGRLLKVIQAEGAGQTLMGLAHEINQPLAAIAAYNQACLRMAENSDTVPEEMKKAIRATAENAMLAGDILRKFRGLVAATRVDREAMQAGKVIQEAVETARGRIRQEGVHIAIGVDYGLPEVYGDPTLIKQVILNLIANAVDAMAGQKVRELAILARRDQGDKVRIEVTDTGPGVRERLRDKIFEPYFTTKAGGLGMGLAICRSIMEAHGESLDFSSGRHGGTVFSFTLGTRAD